MKPERRILWDEVGVIAHVEKPWFLKGKTFEEQRDMAWDRCKDLENEIKRHCDNVESLERIVPDALFCTACDEPLEIDEEDGKCAFCGAEVEQ